MSVGVYSVCVQLIQHDLLSLSIHFLFHSFLFHLSPYHAVSLTVREVKLSVVSYLTNSIVDQILQELYSTHKALVRCHCASKSLSLTCSVLFRVPAGVPITRQVVSGEKESEDGSGSVMYSRATTTGVPIFTDFAPCKISGVATGDGAACVCYLGDFGLLEYILSKY